MKTRAGALSALCLVAGMAVGCDEHQVSGCGPNDKPAPAPPAAAKATGITCSGNPDDWKPSPVKRGPTRLAEVERASVVVKAARRDLFNGDNLVGNCHVSAPIFFNALATEMRAKGVCAWGAGDAVHPVSTVAGYAEEYHLINFGGCKLWPASRQNYKGDWIMRD